MSRRTRDAALVDGSATTAPAGSPNIKLPNANPIWLHAGGDDKFLLLEDPETGDVLMPLIYMKSILEANYSRKLAALKHRQVTVPGDSPLADKGGLLYWQWAFEAPLSIKAIVRRELGNENTPQGHLRLVLVPIVYNAMAQREDLHTHPLFRALHKALRQSSYWPLLIPPIGSIIDDLEAEGAQESEDTVRVGSGQGGTASQALFAGPITLEASAMKYMFLFKDQDELEQSKKSRTTAAGVQQDGIAIMEAAMRRAGSQQGQPSASGMAMASQGAAAGGSTLETASNQQQRLLRQREMAAEAAAEGAPNDSLWPPSFGRPQPDLQLQLLWPQTAVQQQEPQRQQQRQQQSEERQPALQRQAEQQQHSDQRRSQRRPQRHAQMLDGDRVHAGLGGSQLPFPSAALLPSDQQQQLMLQAPAEEEQQQQQQQSLVAQLQQVLQQELSPVREKLEALAEEVTSLRRCVAQMHSLLTPPSGATSSQLQMPPPLPPSWPVLPSHKSQELQLATQEQRDLLAAAAATDSEDLRALLQQQLGVVVPSAEPQAGQGRQHQRQVQQPTAQRAAEVKGNDSELGSRGLNFTSPLASLNFLVDQFSSLKDILPIPSTGGIASLGGGGTSSFGRPAGLPAPSSGGSKPRTQGDGGLAAGPEGSFPGAVGSEGKAGVDSLAAAAGALAEAVSAGASGPGAVAATLSGDILQARPSVLLDSGLNWSQLLTDLRSGTLDAAIQSLQHGAPKDSMPPAQQQRPQQPQQPPQQQVPPAQQPQPQPQPQQQHASQQQAHAAAPVGSHAEQQPFRAMAAMLPRSTASGVLPGDEAAVARLLQEHRKQAAQPEQSQNVMAQLMRLTQGAHSLPYQR